MSSNPLWFLNGWLLGSVLSGNTNVSGEPIHGVLWAEPTSIQIVFAFVTFLIFLLAVVFILLAIHGFYDAYRSHRSGYSGVGIDVLGSVLWIVAGIADFLFAYSFLYWGWL